MPTLRAAAVLFLLILISALCVPLQWLALRLNLNVQRWIPVLFHRMSLAAMGIRVRVHGVPAAERPLLLISNHASWLDIPVLSAHLPVVFIAKSEIAGWPLFGLFARLQRSVFVDRSRRQATVDVNRTIASRLANGDPVVLFGEGTASDGNRVLPFRSALIGALREALGASGRGYVQPVSIAYTRLHGLPMGRLHRPLAAWYGDINLVSHLAAVLREGAIDAVVTFGAPMAVLPGDDRKSLARTTEDAVRRMTAAVLAGREQLETVPMRAETR